ncbi:MAG: hypothetical protein AAF433_16885 [Bacteroidota bacterium]
MSRITFDNRNPPNLPKGQHKYDKEVSVIEVQNRVKSIVRWSLDTKYVHHIFIYGMGAQPKSVYDHLSKTKGLNLLWCSSMLPKYLRFLNAIISSHAGFMLIIDPHIVEGTFLTLLENSMVGLYVIFEDLTDEMVSVIKENSNPDILEVFISGKDDMNFIYQVDADNIESSTNIYEVISYGPNCIDELKNI